MSTSESKTLRANTPTPTCACGPGYSCRPCRDDTAREAPPKGANQVPSVSSRRRFARWHSKAARTAQRRRLRALGAMSRTRPTGITRLWMAHDQIATRMLEGARGAHAMQEREWARARNRNENGWGTPRDIDLKPGEEEF